MAKHTELVSVPGPPGYRFCLDQVARDDDDGRTEYAFVWRGNARTPEGFQQRPAYFDWETLGKTIRTALAEGKISREQGDIFLRTLLGV